MKKNPSLLSLMTVAMCGVFTSCTQDAQIMQEPSEPAEASAQKLEFYLDVKTRGEDVTLQNLDTIYVFGTYMDENGTRQSCFSTSEYAYGFVPFIRRTKKNPGEYTSEVAEDHYYRPETDMYWEDEWAETCQFFALNVEPNAPLYGEYKGDTTWDGEFGTIEKSYAYMKHYGGNTFGVINFYQPPLVKDQIDVVYANNGGATKAGSRHGIPLDFYHLYSAFDVKFKQSPEISDYVVKIYAADIVQKSVKGYWFDLGYNDSFNPAGGAEENGNIITCPDQGYLQVTDTPQRLNDIKPYAYLIPSQVYSPSVENNMFKRRANAEGNPLETVFLKLYLTVEDKNGNVVYPTEEDLKNDFRNKNNVSSNAAQKTDYDFWDKIGVTYLSLGRDFEAKKGNRYSITVDLSFGVGYFSEGDQDGNDPNGEGGLPVLNRHPTPLGANVWIKDYDTPDSNSMTVVPHSTSASE